MISLIITIIVIILLVSIAIFSGMETPQNASLAKFISEFSDYSLAVSNDYIERYRNNFTQNLTRTKAQVYYEIASGRDDIEMNTPTVSSMLVTDLKEAYGKIMPDDLKGVECYEVTHDYNIKDIKNDKIFYTENEKHYITDEGIAFVLPGYPEYAGNEVEKWWINEKQYYTGEPWIPEDSGDVILPEESGEGLTVKDIKITTDSEGTTEAGDGIVENTKLYIQMKAYEGEKEATITPAVPFEVTKNGIYEFTITGSNGQTLKQNVNVNNYQTNLVVKDIKITSDKEGNEEVGNGVVATTKLYIQMKAYEGEKEATITPAVPFEIMQNGTYEFTITGSQGQTLIQSVNVTNYKETSLADILKPGNYVAYNPTKNEYTLDDSNKDEYTSFFEKFLEWLFGFQSDDTLKTDSSATWRVIYSNSETGEVLLTTDDPVNRNTTLYGLDGYFNGVKILDNMCSSLYSNSELGLTARSMTIEDVNKICGYSAEDFADDTESYAYCLRNNQGRGPGGNQGGGYGGNQDSTTSYNGKTYKKSYVSKYSEFYVSDGGGEIKTSGDGGYTYRVPTSDSPVYVTETYYTYNLETQDKAVREILGSGSCWLASQCTYLTEDAECLCLRTITSDWRNYKVTAQILYDSESRSNFRFCWIKTNNFA